MRWLARFGTLVAVGALGAGLAGSRAHAQDGPQVDTVRLEGCRGAMVSLRQDGSRRDAAIGSDRPSNSRSDPFNVGWDDTVEWDGEIPEAPGELRWTIKVAGVTVDEGSKPANRTTWQGSFDVSDILPFKVTGLYRVEWDLQGEGLACHGEAWVKLDGSPWFTAPWFVGAGFLMLALGGVWLARPTRRGVHLRTEDSAP